LPAISNASDTRDHVIFDALDDGVRLERRVQLAIVGSGPVGITLARELSDCADVLVIESGGLRAEPEYEALNVGDCDALPYPLTETRTRQFGGSTALWAGYCAPFDAHDFVPRPWVPASGWPFGIEELRPYYPKSAALLNITDATFNARRLAQLAGIELPFADGQVIPSVWQFGSPILRLNQISNPKSQIPNPEHSGITALIHATVVDIRLDASHSAVTELVVRTMNGRQGRIAADTVVVASGGIETARLLLNADSQVPGGIGNSRGLVGRYFMEHPHLPIATLDLEPERLQGFIEKQESAGGQMFLFNVGLPAPVQEAACLLNARAHVYRTPSMRLDESPRIGLFMEQAPNPGSRVTLAPRTDALGMRCVRLHWELTELEWHTYRESGALFRTAFAQTGVGRVTPLGSCHDTSLILYSNHHLGTTRMARTPDEGVVDANGRLHEVGNLYLMGGGVYPTVSWANPTLTLMALTYRLADHLRQKLAA
jgi:choline dehydrogenase-like flavoprotein